MQVSLALLLLVVSLLVPLVPAADDDPACQKNPVAVEEFFASAYTALLVTNDPDFLANFSLSGGEAGMQLYHAVKEIYEQLRVCNYEEIAFMAGIGVSGAGSLTIPQFLQGVVYAVGSSLYQHGVLECGNALQLALEYFGYVQREAKGLDRRQFETYVRIVSFGWRDILVAHGLDLGTLTTDAAAVFKQSFDDGGKKKCKFDEEDPQ